MRAWQDAGCPDYSGAQRLRFPQWRNVIGGILQIVGIGGFLENIEAQRQNIGGTSGDDWIEFVALWHETHGEKFVTAKELLPLAEKCNGIAAGFEKAEGASRARKLMSFVRARRDRIFGGLKIVAGSKIDRQSSYHLVPKLHTPHTPHTVSVNARNYTNTEDRNIENNNNEKNAHFARIRTECAECAECAITHETAETDGVEYEI